MLTFLAAGLAFTVFLRPDENGSLKNYLGYLLLTLAVYDIFVLLIIPFFKKPNPKKML